MQKPKLVKHGDLQIVLMNLGVISSAEILNFLHTYQDQAFWYYTLIFSFQCVYFNYILLKGSDEKKLSRIALL